MGLHHKRQPREFLLIPGTKVSTYGSFGRLQKRVAKVSFYVASVAERLISWNIFLQLKVPRRACARIRGEGLPLPYILRCQPAWQTFVVPQQAVEALAVQYKAQYKEKTSHGSTS